MKNVFLIVLTLTAMNVYSQDKTNFINKQLFGDGTTEPLSISIDVYPFLLLSEGGGGSLSLEFSNWQIGAVGFSVAPPEFITATFFENMENVSVLRNNAFEVFVNYYLRKDRKGIYGGLLGGPEWFTMKDELSGAEKTIAKSYIVPRMGMRMFPFKKYFYFDASFGWSFNLSGTDTMTLGDSKYNATSGGFIYFLQLGARFNLSK